MSYKPSGVDVNVLDNPRLINVGDQTRLVAVVGLGPASVSVTSEAVVRGTGATDYLSTYYLTGGITGVNISVIADRSGVITGKGNQAISLNGSLYSIASVSVGDTNGTGSITWTGSGANVPSSGQTYYVTYTYDSPAAQFNPIVYSDTQHIYNDKGQENNTIGILSVAGALVLENGAGGVMLCQVSGSTYSEAAYKTAIDKLRVKNNIEQLICVFPIGTTWADQISLLTYAYSHVKQMTSIGLDRGLVFGSPTAYYSADGFDAIGDTSTSSSYVYESNLFKDPDAIYTTGGRWRRYDINGNLMELDGNFAACAVAGLQCAQQLRVTPINGFIIHGLIGEDDKWNTFEKNQLGAGNCTVLQSTGGIVTIYDFLTTDPTSADTIEPTVRSARRLVKRTLQTGLYNTYTNKGKVITKNTTIDVEATTYSILQGMINGGDIYDFGKKDDPSTGELQISAQQNRIDPRQIDVTCSVKYLYPLKFLSVTVSTYL